MANPKSAILLFADSDKSSDMLYFGNFFAPDPFLAIGIDDKKIAILNALEFDRAQKESSFTEILPLEEIRIYAQEIYKKKEIGLVEMIQLVAKTEHITSFTIPNEFPAGLALELQKAKIHLTVATSHLFPERRIKTKEQAELIRKANLASAAGIEAAERALEKSNIKEGKLMLDGKPLTSERMQSIVDIACLEAGSSPKDTIVAGGKQACDPHCRGSGPLKANELIIVDVFPRNKKSGYYGDMTRTFLKGKPSDAQIKLVTTVQEAQAIALKKISSSVSGKQIHDLVNQHFITNGFITEKQAGKHVGFFHGTGHGLGLDLHEEPRVSPHNPNLLEAGNVVTVEPGLYYPKIGGCRIEDVVFIEKKSAKLLSKFHYKWIIN